MDYEYLHEIECVELRSVAKRPVTELLPEFRSLGFTLHDDVVSLDRKGKIPPWQHTSIVEVEVQCEGDEVFGFEEGEWDVLQLKYLFATLPFELADRFIDVVFQLAGKLEASVTYRGVEVDASGLKERFAFICDELLSETGEDAGSEGLAILIHSTYPR
ncbi:hypothetical protein DTL21_24050 [Bremerella cremea]|uniref:Uncharacterized protein n=1 Tax=Blastopirellula marina TaxID=124 RepID=A0A2S8FEC2_9BACT|nr:MULTISPECIES: hypothetical protein [Pirellulaceae]PQO30430.1 hypothetical protein C5Y83_24005 [Blastopirellula marina]RCS43783.1 hypothetical protein DTL21_24050 [Bremerella cremea]